MEMKYSKNKNINGMSLSALLTKPVVYMYA